MFLGWAGQHMNMVDVLRDNQDQVFLTIKEYSEWVEFLQESNVDQMGLFDGLWMSKWVFLTAFRRQKDGLSGFDAMGIWHIRTLP